MSGKPSAWRVTLTWPRPRDWGTPDAGGRVPHYQRSRDTFARPFAMQLLGCRLEYAEMRPRTVALAAVVPAEAPRPSGRWGAARTSAQLAVDVVVFAAVFGAAIVGATPQGTPLPEPVRIKVEPVLDFCANHKPEGA